MTTPALHRPKALSAAAIVACLTGCFADAPTLSAEETETESATPEEEEEETTTGAEPTEDPAESDQGDSTSDDDNDDDADDDDGSDESTDGGSMPPPMPPGCQSDSDCGPGQYCASQCLPVMCGDELVHAAEQCDDGNDQDGDGCDNDCSYTEVVVDVSWHNTCALIEGGRVRCWGDGTEGRLGYGNSETVGDDELPWEVGDVALPLPADQLHSGDDFACALSGDDVYCWGNGDGGAIGSGNLADLGDDELLGRIRPVVLGESITRLTVGGRHSCASGLAGQLRCWGAGPALGYGNELVIGDDEAPSAAGTVSIGAAITDVSAGIEATCVVQTDGAVRCWGTNEQGQLGLGHTDPIGDDELPSTVDALVFAEDALQVTAGHRHTCARFVGGGVRCWGANAYGELGRGDEVQQGDDEVVDQLPLIALGAVPPASHIAAGDNHTCALFENGDIKCWGRNSFGQLGIGSFEHVGDDELPAASDIVDLPGPAIQMDAGGNHTCAVLEDYRVFCWGRNADGQLGLAHNQDIAVPPLAGAIAVLDPFDP